MLLFWLLLLGFGVLVGVTVVVAWLVGRTDKALDADAVTAYRVENGLPLGDVDELVDPDDLEAKWTEFWRLRDLEFRGTDLWARLHDDSDAWVREHPGWQTDDEDVWAARLTDDAGVCVVTDVEAARLDGIDTHVSDRFVRTLDGGLKRVGFAGVVDMYAQWIYARRRSWPRIAVVLAKTESLPEGMQAQLRVLINENAVARGRDLVSSR